jgi:hypothetical protein
MKISILLPSLFPDLAKRSIESLRAGAGDLDYEIIVVSPYEVSGPHIVWSQEIGEARGCTAGYRQAFVQATGDIIMPWTDDVTATPNCIANCLAFFLKRESQTNLYCCGLNYKWDRGAGRFGTVFGIYYPYFPFLGRHTIDCVGGFYASEYVGGFGDPDLGLRIWHARGRCELSAESVILPVPERHRHPKGQHKYSYFLQDMTTFVTRWAIDYGRNWPTANLRDFNIDLPDSALIDNTFFINDWTEFNSARAMCILNHTKQR